MSCPTHCANLVKPVKRFTAGLTWPSDHLRRIRGVKTRPSSPEYAV